LAALLLRENENCRISANGRTTPASARRVLRGDTAAAVPPPPPGGDAAATRLAAVRGEARGDDEVRGEPAVLLWLPPPPRNSSSASAASSVRKHSHPSVVTSDGAVVCTSEPRRTALDVWTLRCGWCWRMSSICESASPSPAHRPHF